MNRRQREFADHVRVNYLRAAQERSYIAKRKCGAPSTLTLGGKYREKAS